MTEKTDPRQLEDEKALTRSDHPRVISTSDQRDDQQAGSETGKGTEQRLSKSEIAGKIVAICMGDCLSGKAVCASFTPTESGFYCKDCGWADVCHADKKAIESLLDQFVEANKMVTDTSSSWQSDQPLVVTSWQTGKPPNETLVEVEHDERGIIRVRSMWGRDGMLPHWESEDRGILWEPSAFARWREIKEQR